MKRFALGIRPLSERVAESLTNVLGGKVHLRMKLCGEPGGLQGDLFPAVQFPSSLSLSHTLIILYLSLFRSFFTSPMVSVCFILSTYIWSPSSDFILSVVRWPGVGGCKSLLTSNRLLISCSTGVSTSVTLLEVPWVIVAIKLIIQRLIDQPKSTNLVKRANFTVPSYPIIVAAVSEIIIVFLQ